MQYIHLNLMSPVIEELSSFPCSSLAKSVRGVDAVEANHWYLICLIYVYMYNICMYVHIQFSFSFFFRSLFSMFIMDIYYNKCQLLWES